MSIRNAAKAIIVHNDKILLNQCYTPGIGSFFTLPGGGQFPYETMEEAVVRECLEETGYTVLPETFVALYEEIYTSNFIRERYPDYAHKIFHIFRCSLADVSPHIPTEPDTGQLDCVWIPCDKFSDIKILPARIGDNIQALLCIENPCFLGTDFIDFERIF